MLTPKQHELLRFINTRLENGGISPSFEEMKDALGLHSKSGVHRLVTALVERGFIRRLPNRARALEVLKLPNNLKEVRNTPVATPSSVINTDFGRQSPSLNIPESANEGGVTIPLHGRIAAGLAVEAMENPDNQITIPREYAGRGQTFAVEVSGDSMIDLGIYDGDTAIIESCQTANNGDIIVALIDNEEATLKTLHKRGEQIALKPANPSHSTQIFPANRVCIQGRLVGLMRRY
jgi:repressor LexA